jgi:mannose-6-phosphate isomerase-like protein (cupin superfamily)
MTTPIADQTILAGKLPTTFVVMAEDVDGAYSLVRQAVPPGVLMLPHTHENEDQVAIVVSGRLGVRVGDREWEVGPGEVAPRPRGLVHTVWNVTDEPVEFLEITSPGNFEEYFAALGELTAGGRMDEASDLAAEWKVRPSIDLAADIAARHGVAL